MDSDGQRWTAQWRLDGNGRRDGLLAAMEARDGASATLMECDCNGNGRQRTARWRLDGDGRRGATTMDGMTVT